MDIDFHLLICLNISDASKLVEVSSEILSSMFQSLVTCRKETSSKDQSMTLVECIRAEILVNWMDLEVTKGVERSYGVLPNVSYQIVKITYLEHIYRIWRQPVL